MSRMFIANVHTVLNDSLKYKIAKWKLLFLFKLKHLVYNEMENTSVCGNLEVEGKGISYLLGFLVDVFSCVRSFLYLKFPLWFIYPV